MSKTTLPFAVADISAFAKSLRSGLDLAEGVPSHVEMLNLLAKAGGYRNFQHFRVQHEARETLAAPRPRPAEPEVDFKRVKRLVRFFDHQGRLIRWPKKFTQRVSCLWVIWSRIPARTPMTEPELCDRLEALHLFGDHALLRRELVDQGLMERTPDCREYRRLEVKPTSEARALLEQLRG